MAFFANDAINRVIAHSAVQTLAQAGGGIFFFAFLLEAGVPAHWVLLAEAGVVAGRFVLRPAVLPLARRFGLKPLLISGALAMALPYPLLAEVDGVSGRLAVLALSRCVAEVLYWVAYNAYFAAVGDADGRGRQISAREALVASAAIVAPLIGAFALTHFAARATFGIAAVVQAASVLPLIGAPNVAVKVEATGVLRAARATLVLSAADGWLDTWLLHVWQMVLFLTLGRSFEAYGGAMALAGLSGAAFGLLLGRHVDAGGGRRAVALAYGMMGLVVVLRAASGGLPELAVIANAAGPVAFALLSPALGAAISNSVKASPCALRTTVANEGAWDVGCFTACVTGASIAASGAPLAPAILLALPAVALTAVVLRRYYARVALGTP
jgi:MFS transporter, DHA1 family, inner membrane transport protein